MEPTNPTSDPSASPTADPTVEPTSEPTTDPTLEPTTPTVSPTTDPTGVPSTPPPTNPDTVFPGSGVNGQFNNAPVIIPVTCFDCAVATFNASLSTLFGVTLVLRDASGAVVANGTSDVLELTNLTAGNYTLELDADDVNEFERDEDDDFGAFDVEFDCESVAPSPAPTDSPAPTEDSGNCDDCPYSIVLSTISSISVENCETVSPTPKPTNRWSGWSDSSDSSNGGRRRTRRLMISSYDGVSGGSEDVPDSNDSDGDTNDSDAITDSDSGSDSDSGDTLDGPGKCVHGKDIIFMDPLCDDDYTANDPTTDGFLAEICVTYNITEITPDSDCGEINSLFLELCTDDTDFDPDALGIGDISNIISDDTFSGNNVENASGSRNDDGDLGIIVVLEDSNVDSYTLCFDKVIVTTSFNQTKDDLDVAEGTFNYSNSECDGIGLPCLILVDFIGFLINESRTNVLYCFQTDFFFGCHGDLIGPEDGTERIDVMEAQFSGKTMASNALTATGMTLNSPLRIWKELDPFIQYLLIGLFIAFIALIAVSCCICVFGKNGRRKTLSIDSVVNHIEMAMRYGHHHVPQETCGELEFDDELADNFDGYFEEEIESPTGYKSVSTEFVE